MASPTLLYKSAVDDPDGALERSGDRRRGVASGTAHSLDAPEKENHDANHGDGGGDAGPNRQIKRRQQRENIDLLLCFAHEDSHRIVHVALAEVHHALALRGDGDGGHGQVGLLWVKNNTISSIRHENLLQKYVQPIPPSPTPAWNYVSDPRFNLRSSDIRTKLCFVSKKIKKSTFYPSRKLITVKDAVRGVKAPEAGPRFRSHPFILDSTCLSVMFLACLLPLRCQFHSFSPVWNQKWLFFSPFSLLQHQQNPDFIVFCQTFSMSIQKAQIKSGWNFPISSTGENRLADMGFWLGQVFLIFSTLLIYLGFCSRI